MLVAFYDYGGRDQLMNPVMMDNHVLQLAHVQEELRQQAVERSRREAEEERARRKREADLKRDAEAAAASRARAAQEGKENASSPGARGTKRADAVCRIYIHGLEHMH